MTEKDKLHLRAIFDAIVSAERDHHNRMIDIINKLELTLKDMNIQ